MNLRNYEIAVICDFQLLHLLLANLGSVPDLSLSLLSLDFLRHEEVENQNDSN
jgi:hypothetical protein